MIFKCDGEVDEEVVLVEIKQNMEAKMTMETHTIDAFAVSDAGLWNCEITGEDGLPQSSNSYRIPSDGKFEVVITDNNLC